MTKLCGFLLLLLTGSGEALDNGLGITPPRGWRSWDAFENSATQQLQEKMVDALVDTSRTVDGVPTSLLQLGYNRIGLDDSWQDCGKGVNGSFHNAKGTPLINKQFPDMAGMNAYAKAKGIGSGWYLNSCDCCERGSLQPDWPPQMRGDANAIFELGFDGIKLDSCGPSQHLLEWVALLNETGKPILVENCFDNASFPFTTSGVDNGNEVVEEDACPMNMFRSGGDMRAQWPLMLRRLQTVVPWLRLSRPKCWAYLDMLEVGNPPGGTGEQPSFENKHSWRAHFGAWAINSSPLILSFDLANATKLDAVWPFITNKEVLAINSNWAGEAGRLVSSDYDKSGPTPVFVRPCSTGVDSQKFILGPSGKIRSDSASDDRCVSVPSCAARASAVSATTATPGAIEMEVVTKAKTVTVGAAGDLTVSKCNATSQSQQWIVTGPAGDSTQIVSAASGRAQHCWEIDGCSSASPASVDTNYMCKPLPRPGWRNHSSPCVANMAWSLNSNGTITSTMDGSCIQISSTDEYSVVVAKCNGSKRQRWHTNTAEGSPADLHNPTSVQIVSALGGCIDNDAPKAYNPQYGGLVLKDCKASLCSSQDHEWIHDPTTKQLVSKVPGANSGSTVCAQIGGYANHYSLLSAVDCAPANAVPKNQQWEVDALNERVSIDVRFDATQQRSPGQLLCFDVDMGATPSGKVGPGSKLLSQVWAKKQPGGAVAVLIINADNSTARNVGVTMASLGLAGKTSVTARDVWAKKDLPDVDGPTFTAIAIPPQDSRFLLFK